MERLSISERSELWDRWEAGESQRSIARALERSPSTVRTQLLSSGWRRPVRVGEWCSLRLSLGEREEISRGIAQGESLRSIAARLGRASSTVSREVANNGGCDQYRAVVAHRASRRRARRPKAMKLAECPRLCEAVEEKLLLWWWSPGQISRWLVRAYPDDEEMRVSHETIYQSLFVQGRGALRKELWRALRTGRARRRPQGRPASTKGQIRDMVMISERPAEVADRAVPGHWEGDLIVGKRKTSIGTLVERQSRYVMLFQVPDNTAESVRVALTDTVKKLPEHLWRSLTWDQGTEMAQHAQFTIDTGIQVYFCDPKSPWQRGSNENTNGLLRQYFPKGTDLSLVSQDQLDHAAYSLNTRPRQTLGDMTPSERLAAAMQ